MARKYPRFLLSNPSNTKSSGPFVVHTLNPQFIVAPKFDDKRNLIDTILIDVWSKDSGLVEVYEIMKDIPSWFKHSGRLQSNNEDDLLINEINKLEFLSDRKSHFTIDQARDLIKILFPTKSKVICHSHSSYGYKHLFESVSSFILGDRYSSYKYCSNNTAIKAFELEGFKLVYDGSPNPAVNLSSKEVNRAYRLFR
jgi:hypothetical protein